MAAIDGNTRVFQWKFVKLMCYICENHLIYCLTEKTKKRAPLMYERTNERRHFRPPWHFVPKDVISAHHRISRRKTSFPPTIAFHVERRTLKAKFFLCYHSFAASCHAVSNDFIPSVIYKGAYHNNNKIFTFQILSTLFNCFSTEKA